MDAVVKEAARTGVVDLVSQPADLEEIFLELYRGGRRCPLSSLRRGLLDHRRALVGWCARRRRATPR